MSEGIHHVTAVTRRVQANVDFYAGFLGLRLVKQTGGFEDGEQLHLFYGDAAGSPGSLITFLVWEDGAAGRVGHGQIGEIALAVPPHSIGDWLSRALAAGVPHEGPLRAFGETTLRLKDPDGISVVLVGVDLPSPAPLQDPLAPTRLRGVTLFSEDAEATAQFVARFGYAETAREGAVRRMLSGSDAVDIRDAAGFFAGIPGTGIFDHLAFRAPDMPALNAMHSALRQQGATTVHDRKYFRSLYARDAAGLLFEYATDAPGFAVDEDLAHLGETLFVPPQDADRAEDLRVMMPQFARPGAPRLPLRDLPFAHRFYHPKDPDGSVIVALHGSGGAEADLFGFAHRMNPRATLLGVRGRATEEGTARWFRRLGAGVFDQADIRSEAEAFTAFLDGAVKSYGLERDRMTVLGYSNGANFAAAVMALYPDAIGQAVLLRTRLVLEDLPQVDLSNLTLLTLAGAQDPDADQAQGLAEWMAARGAQVKAQVVQAGHTWGDDDLRAAQDWINGVGND